VKLDYVGSSGVPVATSTLASASHRGTAGLLKEGVETIMKGYVGYGSSVFRKSSVGNRIHNVGIKAHTKIEIIATQRDGKLSRG
jgi:hypothetical protein